MGALSQSKAAPDVPQTHTPFTCCISVPHAHRVQGVKAWLIRKAIAAKQAGLAEGKYASLAGSLQPRQVPPALFL